MNTHVVVGAGPVGRETARLLARAGQQVLLVSRSGTGPEVPGVRRTAADATSSAELSRLAGGADAVYNCVNPPEYHRWPELWPPIAAAFLAAAEDSGAVLVTAGNLYPYGPVDGPMVEGMPDAGTGAKARVRAQMWAEALAAHEAGRIRAVEVRGSDYMGADVGEGAHVPRVVPQALAGKPVRVFGDPDQPHSWTDVHDMARALVTVASEGRTWGRVWHAPTNPPCTQREAIADVCRVAGREPVPVKGIPRLMVTVGGVFVPVLGALRETVYQFERPYVLDSTAIQTELGLMPSPWEDICRRTAGVSVTEGSA
jgi:nucleoside-diphosphate-sugar epimerase